MCWLESLIELFCIEFEKMLFGDSEIEKCNELLREIREEREIREDAHKAK